MNTKATDIAKVEPTEQVALTPMDMLKIAVDRGADLDQMQQLMDLNDRWEANQARKAYTAAVAAFKANPPTVLKDQKADFGGGKAKYTYATLAQVTGIIAPALSQHGLSHRWTVDQKGAEIAVTCVLTHQMGHSESVTLTAAPDPTGSKNPIQAIGSTVSYLERYTLLAITGLAALDQDDDGSGGGKVELISAEQKQTLVDLLKSTKSDQVKFLAFLDVPTLDQLPANRFDEAVKQLERKRKAPAREPGEEG